jgi:PAS domain S-box-containing protein
MTDERDLAERLAQSEEANRLLFESHPAPMAIWDPASLQILDANDAAIRFYGYTLDELRRLTIDRLVDRLDWPAMLEAVSRLPVGIAGPGRFRHRRKDGSFVEVDITGHAFEYEGRPARIVMALPAPAGDDD